MYQIKKHKISKKERNFVGKKERKNVRVFVIILYGINKNFQKNKGYFNKFHNMNSDVCFSPHIML